MRNIPELRFVTIRASTTIRIDALLRSPEVARDLDPG
jgi:hypothetical protein